MDQDVYRGLRFERRVSTVPGRLIALVLSLALFSVLWVLVPQSALYWLLLPLVAVLTWVASYGWRRALVALHDLLHRISNV